MTISELRQRITRASHALDQAERWRGVAQSLELGGDPALLPAVEHALATADRYEAQARDELGGDQAAPLAS